MPSLIQTLADGPLDIVGDVHGEIDALRQLLRHLRYNDDGRHPGGRQLVFVGDLVNRGPDSPSVSEWVADLVRADRARCLLGNHELDLLLGNRKAHSNWFYGEPQLDEAGRVIPQQPAGDNQRSRIQEWFRTLPLALIRRDLRIVHACWDAEMIELVRNQTDVLQVFEQARTRIEVGLVDCKDDVQRALEHQNCNPVLKLTSGPELRLESPVRRGMRIRNTRRVAWWEQYEDLEFCVFGHYAHVDRVCLGSRSSLCIDFGAGRRWTERRIGITESFTWKLAALRFPEREIVFDDGGRRLHESAGG